MISGIKHRQNKGNDEKRWVKVLRNEGFYILHLTLSEGALGDYSLAPHREGDYGSSTGILSILL